MALPTSASTSWLFQRAGVRAMVFTTDPSCGLQVEISTASGAPTSKWLVKRMNPSVASQVVHTFEVPYSTKQWFIRAKSWKAGQADSHYTTVGAVTPQLLHDMLPHPGMEARRLTQFGAFTTANSRTFRVPFSAFIPADNTQKWKHSTAGWVQPNSTAGARIVAPVVLPPGVTITGIAGRFFHANITDLVTFRFGRLGESGSITAMSTLINTGGGAGSWVTSTQSLSESVTSTKSYVVRVDFGPTAASSNERVARFDVIYTRPSFDRAY